MQNDVNNETGAPTTGETPVEDTNKQEQPAEAQAPVAASTEEASATQPQASAAEPASETQPGTAPAPAAETAPAPVARTEPRRVAKPPAPPVEEEPRKERRDRFWRDPASSSRTNRYKRGPGRRKVVGVSERGILVDWDTSRGIIAVEEIPGRGRTRRWSTVES